MLSGHNLASLVGADVIDVDGQKIGTVGRIFVNPATGRPNWATVVTGFFGSSVSFVPLEAAESVEGELRIPYRKDVVKDAPRIKSDDELTDVEESNLYEYYGGPATV